ncbi:MAG: AmmeMemoRadiSam system radical SAM enzyme [Patescibacteria group bacterium]
MKGLYKKDKNFIKCLACSHYCKIAEGHAGICGVRENQNGELKLLVYGRPCAAHVDPIEKKPFYHFLPGTKILSLGTFGCNLGCGFCQNWDISQISRHAKEAATGWKDFLAKIDYLSPEAVVKMALENHLPTIAFTYNEPTIWTEYAIDIAKLAKKAGLKCAYVSNGYMSKETCDYIAPYIDAINIDLKSFSDKFYIKTCQARLQPVLDNIKRLHKAGLWIEITTLVIPGENDSPAELKKIAEFIVSVSPDIPWHLSAFYPNYEMTGTGATDPGTLHTGQKIGQDAGLKYVYLGNIN